MQFCLPPYRKSSSAAYKESCTQRSATLAASCFGFAPILQPRQWQCCCHLVQEDNMSTYLWEVEVSQISDAHSPGEMVRPAQEVNWWMAPQHFLDFFLLALDASEPRSPTRPFEVYRIHESWIRKGIRGFKLGYVESKLDLQIRSWIREFAVYSMITKRYKRHFWVQKNLFEDSK